MTSFALAFTPFQAGAASNPRYASIVIDADTGEVLHERYADKSLHPASLTKIMTLYMVFEALDQGRMGLNDRIRISSHAAGMVPSKLDLPAGSSIKVQDAVYALVTKSANDIAVAVAEHIGGTEYNFGRMMTRRAHSLGMEDTVFRNASGLHDPGQVTTARDMATLGRIMINNYPEYYRYFSTKNFSYLGKNYHNHNRLMSSYKGMDGIKTGYINASGFNLVASAVQNNRRLVGVVFGGRTSQTRNAHMAELLDRSFAQMGSVRIASVSVPVPPKKPGLVTALDTLNTSIASNLGQRQSETQRLALLEPSLEDKFGELLGEGDYDPAATQRIETGLMAISAHKGKAMVKKVSAPAVPKVLNGTNNWAIQIGAFQSRVATDKALSETKKKLPAQYASASPMIAPLKTKDGWLFRARLTGFSKSDAFRACSALSECMPVPMQ